MRSRGHQRSGQAQRRRPRLASVGRGRCRADGSVYVLVLGISLIVSVIGVSAVALARLSLRSTAGSQDATEAALLARSATELAIARVNVDPQWRTNHYSGVETPQVQFGRGTISYKLIDEEDGNLADSPGDPVRVMGIGRVGRAAQAYSVLLAGTAPLEALGTCIHSSGQLHIKSGKELTVADAPASTNANFRNDGVLYGGIDAATQSGGGSVTGEVTIPAPAKALPATTVFGQYVARATAITYAGNFDRHVLTPTLNEYGGGLDPEGIYYVNTKSQDLTIKNSRIHGTLVLDATGKKVTVDGCVLLHNYRPERPVLIVKGDLELIYDSTSSGETVFLDEASCGHNFNPPGAAYDGQADDDLADRYPSEIRGLVHCTGNVTFKDTARVRGVILCEGAVTVDGYASVIHDPLIPRYPPPGYATCGGDMAIIPGSWRREPVP